MSCVTARSKSEKRFDHYFHDFEHDGALLQRHAQCSAKAVRLAKCAAFRMAKTYLEIIRGHQEKLLAQVRSNLDVKTIEEWLDRWFAPLVMIGGDRCELINSVQEGMKLKQYLASSAGVFLSRKKAQSCRARDLPSPSEPSADLPIEERFAQEQECSRVLRRQLSEARKEAHALRQRVAHMEKELRRIHKVADKELKALVLN